jgi:hypothetical protein
MVHSWLAENMLAGEADPMTAAQSVIGYLASHSATAAHARHIPSSKCETIGLKIERLEDDKKLQDLVLTVHHSYMHTFSMSPAVKITENHLGTATVLMGAMPQVFGQMPMQAFLPTNAIPDPSPATPAQPTSPTPPAVDSPSTDGIVAGA